MRVRSSELKTDLVNPVDVEGWWRLRLQTSDATLFRSMVQNANPSTETFWGYLRLSAAKRVFCQRIHHDGVKSQPPVATDAAGEVAAVVDGKTLPWASAKSLGWHLAEWLVVWASKSGFFLVKATLTRFHRPKEQDDHFCGFVWRPLGPVPQQLMTGPGSTISDSKPAEASANHIWSPNNISFSQCGSIYLMHTHTVPCFILGICMYLHIARPLVPGSWIILFHTGPYPRLETLDVDSCNVPEDSLAERLQQPVGSPVAAHLTQVTSGDISTSRLVTEVLHAHTSATQRGSGLELPFVPWSKHWLVSHKMRWLCSQLAGVDLPSILNPSW